MAALKLIGALLLGAALVALAAVHAAEERLTLEAELARQDAAALEVRAEPQAIDQPRQLEPSRDLTPGWWAKLGETPICDPPTKTPLTVTTKGTRR